MTKSNNPGEDKAWELLTDLDPDQVCRGGSVSYDPGPRTYNVRSFDIDFQVSLRDKTISSSAPGSDVLLRRLGYFFRLSLLWYLVHAKDIACSGRPVKLEGIRGGEIFSKGSHVLPLEQLAGKYGRNKAGFLEKGKELGGESLLSGDAALRLHPLPRIPVVLTLWLEDEEFPARADLFFDSTCELQLPTDILWSIAMLSVLVLL